MQVEFNMLNSMVKNYLRHPNQIENKFIYRFYDNKYGTSIDEALLLMLCDQLKEVFISWGTTENILKLNFNILLDPNYKFTKYSDFEECCFYLKNNFINDNYVNTLEWHKHIIQFNHSSKKYFGNECVKINRKGQFMLINAFSVVLGDYLRFENTYVFISQVNIIYG